MKWIKIGIVLFAASAVHAFAQTPHTATYTITSTSCTSAAPCTAQVFRVVVANNGTCPAVGNAAYINVQASLPATTATTTNSTWNYVDSGASLTSGSTYCGYSTVTFNAGGGPSGAGAIFQGTIPTPLSPPPPPTYTVILK